MTNEPIVILASRSPTTYLMINHLAERFAIAHVIFEAPHMRKMLRYRLRALGLWQVLAQLLFLVWDRLMIQPRSTPMIARILKDRDIRPPDGRIPTTDVESVNGAEVKTLLGHLKPKVVVVSGTSIIGKKVLGMAPTFINIHCGITPRYRGVHGAFWAIYEGRPELAGVTVHLIDAGVDTGAILGQAKIEVDPRTDSYRTLPVKQYLVGLNLMNQAVEDALRDQFVSCIPISGLESRQWYSPTPIQYLRFLSRLKRLGKKQFEPPRRQEKKEM
jgi:hypothetical protein